LLREILKKLTQESHQVAHLTCQMYPLYLGKSQKSFSTILLLRILIICVISARQQVLLVINLAIGCLRSYIPATYYHDCLLGWSHLAVSVM